LGSGTATVLGGGCGGGGKFVSFRGNLLPKLLETLEQSVSVVSDKPDSDGGVFDAFSSLS